MPNKEIQYIDARSFQRPLAELAETIALKVQREAVKTVKPGFLAIDVYVMIRHVLKTYELFFYINADERRQNDSAWHVGFSVAALPLVRCMIDSLYNITMLLDDPANAYKFRASGYRQSLEAIAKDEARYGGDPTMDAYIASRREFIGQSMRADGTTIDEVSEATLWPTMSAYLRTKEGVPLTPHQSFLKELTYGFWQEYSGIAHSTFQGLMRTATFYSPRDVPHEKRDEFDEAVDAMISMHLKRVVGVLLCVLTEVQAHFRFEGARINQRLHRAWDAVIAAAEIRELYDLRYKKLMEDRGLNRETPDA
ncbi:MAG TPA: hypothetical protein VEG64_02975 [Candidatus Sulfotelmatobacter sp.]|nr:hypothetical protein [Candidatus Sulfotelmatobacter sp.]